MTYQTSIFNAEQVFHRACLESAPRQGAQGRSSNLWAAVQKRTPAQLHVLKQKLLHAALGQTPQPQAQKQLCGAANVAAEMVWDTACPLLLFQCLFEEMAENILGRFVPDEPAYSTAPVLSEENDPAFGGLCTANA